MSNAPHETAQAAPRPVSRGANLRVGFIGIDSLYLVLEYPFMAIFKKYASLVTDREDRRLNEGIPFEDDFLIRRGGLGYKLSVWDGDARLFITDRVEEKLADTAASGQGMGVMLQLGPKWLRMFGEVIEGGSLERNVHAQFAIFGIHDSPHYPVRLNRIDITLDVIGLDVASFSLDEWRTQWVGYAKRKDFHDSSETGQLQGLSIGSSEGAIRFKVYDKVQEAAKKKSLRFWRSVWGLNEDEYPPVARFEWTIKAYEARFSGTRYLHELNFLRFLDLFNYASLEWGRLCLPDPSDSNRSRWELAPLWSLIRELIDEYSQHHDTFASREYDLTPDLNPMYLKSVAGWIGGYMARLGIEFDTERPATVIEALKYLKGEGLSLSTKAKEKWEVFSRLTGKKP